VPQESHVRGAAAAAARSPAHGAAAAALPGTSPLWPLTARRDATLGRQRKVGEARGAARLAAGRGVLHGVAEAGDADAPCWLGVGEWEGWRQWCWQWEGWGLRVGIFVLMGIRWGRVCSQARQWARVRGRSQYETTMRQPPTSRSCCCRGRWCTRRPSCCRGSPGRRAQGTCTWLGGGSRGVGLEVGSTFGLPDPEHSYTVPRQQGRPSHPSPPARRRPQAHPLTVRLAAAARVARRARRGRVGRRHGACARR
jgi:hypothetical protein